MKKELYFYKKLGDDEGIVCGFLKQVSRDTGIKIYQLKKILTDKKFVGWYNGWMISSCHYEKNKLIRGRF